jgi:hypothetical protein
MNIAEARAELSRPLVFGDERQLRARDFLLDVERCHTRLLSCRWCHAEGVTRAPGRTRPEQCDCVRKFDREVIEACGITYIETREQDVAERRRAGMRLAG